MAPHVVSYDWFYDGCRLQVVETPAVAAGNSIGGCTCVDRWPLHECQEDETPLSNVSPPSSRCSAGGKETGGGRGKFDRRLHRRSAGSRLPSAHCGWAPF